MQPAARRLSNALAECEAAFDALPGVHSRIVRRVGGGSSGPPCLVAEVRVMERPPPELLACAWWGMVRVADAALAMGYARFEGRVADAMSDRPMSVVMRTV